MKEVKNQFENYLRSVFKGSDLELEEIAEDNKNYFGFTYSKIPYDLPILVLDKRTGKIRDEILPPFTDTSKAKIIWKTENKHFSSFEKK